VHRKWIVRFDRTRRRLGTKDFVILDRADGNCDLAPTLLEGILKPDLRYYYLDLSDGTLAQELRDSSCAR